MNTIPNARNVDKLLRLYRTITLTSVIGLIVVTLAFLYFYLVKIDEITKRAYFVFPNQVYEGDAQNTGLIDYFRAKDHVRKFLGLMFGHDRNTFQSRVEAALNLINREEGKAIYKQFVDSKLHENYVTFGSHSRVEIDSITLDMKKIPITGKAYFNQIMVLPDNTSFPQPIEASFELKQTSFRNEYNSAGLEIFNLKMASIERKEDQYKLPTTETESTRKDVAP